MSTSYKSNTATIQETAGLFSRSKTTLQAKATEAQRNIPALNALLDFVFSLQSFGYILYRCPTRELQVSTLNNALYYLDSLSKPRGCSSACTKLKNELLSLKEGILNTDIPLTKADYTLNILDFVHDTISKKLHAAEKTIEQARLEATRGLESVVKENLENQQLRSSTQTVLDEIEQESSSVLKTIKTQPHVIAHLPVIPLAVLDKEQAKKEGFVVSDLQGYLIFHNQLIVGINKPLTLKEEKEKGNKKVKTEEVLERIISELEIKTGQEFVLVDYRPYQSQASGGMGVCWYWIMLVSQANRFAKLFKKSSRQGVSTIKLENWGLAI